MNEHNIIQQLFWTEVSCMGFASISSPASISLNIYISNQDRGENKQYVRNQTLLFNVLNDDFVAGLIGLVPAQQPWSLSLQYAHAWSAIAVLSVDAIFVN